MSSLSFEMDEVGNQWPLIFYIMKDSEYQEIYKAYVSIFTEEIFTKEKMTETYKEYYDLIKEYAYNEVEGYSFIRSNSEFDKGVETLINHTESRLEAVKSYLDN